jgi:hypothetical protein
MTIKATFPDGTVMLFGDSYRKWISQLQEFCSHFEMPRPEVVKCSAKWIAYGGIKWCPENDLALALEEENQGRSIKDFSKWEPLNQIERRTLEKYIKP